MPKRRAHGEGSIRQRPDGRWEARYTEPETGKRRSVYGDTQRACRDALRAVLRRLDEGKPAQDSRETLRSFLHTWLETVVKPKRAHKTYVSYAERVRLDINPHLGELQLQALTPKRVQTWMAGLAAEVDERGKPRLSARTVEYDHSILRNALNVALKWGLVSRNVAALADAPSVERGKADAYTPEEAQRLIESVAGTRWEAFYRLALGLGLRMGELIGLRWRDIDLERGRLTVARSKTRKGERTINMPDFLVDTLHEHRVLQERDRELLPKDWNPDGLVFPSEAGTRLWEGNLRGTFKRHLRAAGLRPIRFHDLRHTCASYLLNEGVPLKQVSDILGHAQTSTTTEIYWHIANETQRGALDKVRGLVGNKRRSGSGSGSNDT